MKITVTAEKPSDEKMAATLTIPAAEVDAAIARTYKDIAKKYNFQGFRRGHARRPVIDGIIGRESVLAQATNDLLNAAQPLMLEELDVTPVGRVSFGPEDADPELAQQGSDYVVSATIGVRPACELESYDAPTINMPPEEATEAEIAALGVKAKGYASNAANFEETHEVIDRIVKDFGRIDILVNNAGITKDGLMMRMSEAQWDAVLTVNLKSAFNFIHAVTPIMARQKSGSIINMSSVVGVSGNAGQCNYSASKAGMIGLAKSIAKEMGPRGIRANAIAPGFIMTEMTDKLPDEVKEGWYKQIPLRRGGTPEDVAKVALFLASDLSSYVSGQVIHCCGAMNC